MKFTNTFAAYNATQLAVTDREVTQRVGLGRIKGLERRGQFDGASRTWYEFRAIRYSRPIQRFDYPVYNDPVFWEGDYDATEYGVNCPDGYGGGDDEDCLFLNMLVPDRLELDAKLPVLMWIHGGAFLSGSGSGNDVPASQAHYTDGRGLALDQEVLVVNVNYRLGTLGFLSGIDDEHRGNFGVRDQQMAIEWLHRNVEYFGGDPDRISIFGCSAGGRSVGAQVMSPYNVGKLFGAIGQSGDGSSDLMWDQFAEENREMVFNQTGCTSDDERLACLRSKSVAEIQKAVDPIRLKYREWQWGIVLDNDFYTDRCGTNVATNSHGGKECYERVSKYHFMSGCCSADGYGFAPAWIKKPGQGTGAKAHKAIKDFVANYGYSDATYAGIKFAYTDWSDPSDEYMWRNNTVEAETDWRYCFPTLNMHVQRAKVADAKASYLYYFDAPSSLEGGMNGANHCTDNSYEFGWPVVNKWHGSDEEQLSRIMMNYWGNFARTGQPNNAQSHLEWEAFDPERRNYIRFDLADQVDQH